MYLFSLILNYIFLCYLRQICFVYLFHFFIGVSLEYTITIEFKNAHNQGLEVVDFHSIMSQFWNACQLTVNFQCKIFMTKLCKHQ